MCLFYREETEARAVRTFWKHVNGQAKLRPPGLSLVAVSLSLVLTLPWVTLHLSSAQAPGFSPGGSCGVGCVVGAGVGADVGRSLGMGSFSHSHETGTFTGSTLSRRKSPTLCSAEAAGVGAVPHPSTFPSDPGEALGMATGSHVSNHGTERLHVGMSGIAGFESLN